MAVTPPVVLTIAGFDPSSGAGITADIKTIAAHECFGVSCITALTVQSTQGVRRVVGVAPGLIAETLQELVSDLVVEAVHIGMLGNAQVVAVVADFLAKPSTGHARLPHVVLDPILKSSSGADLLDVAGRRLLIERLIPLAELITPNLDEASVLTGMTVTNLDQMHAAAARLHSLGASNVVVTGGHLEKATDLLSFTTGRGTEQEVFKADRQRSSSTHGTGCAFATALACHLAHGRGLPEAVLLSKAYVSAAIANAHPLGKGSGPLHHLYRMGQQRRTSTVVSETEQAHSRS
ncbi:MAG TPA: bifunctional hydroxymethylpyrimidine kinase/phosphomethylpyrimidine kinase [Terriglobales bacterium]|nr:bifunctional hydroxymethylpyrimidine kinase/phosphomethylpyrimidine kinase [Terriglobales bacterium]